MSVEITISTAEGILILLFLWRNNSPGGALEKSKEEIQRKKEGEGEKGTMGENENECVQKVHLATENVI